MYWSVQLTALKAIITRRIVSCGIKTQLCSADLYCFSKMYYIKNKNILYILDLAFKILIETKHLNFKIPLPIYNI